MFAVEMFYDRLDQDNKARIMCKEGASIGGILRYEDEDEEYRELYHSTKYGIWRSNINRYLGTGAMGGEGDDSRFDLTPSVLSIYSASLDSELPGL